MENFCFILRSFSGKTLVLVAIQVMCELMQSSSAGDFASLYVIGPITSAQALEVINAYNED